MSLSFFRRNKISSTQKTNCAQVSYDAYASSDVGAVRENNEDKVLFIKPNNEAILHTKGVMGIVADGMGGHNFGEVASEMAVEIIGGHYYDSNKKIRKALADSIIEANKIIFDKAQSDPKYKGMGTTCTAVILHDRDVYIGHAGDSRAYLVNQEKVTKLTRDHTYIQYLLDHDIIKEEQVRNHPERNVITKSLGTNPDVEPDIMHFKNFLKEEDLIFLCSDGLYEYIKDPEIQELILSHSFSDAAEHLIALAKARGGHDNISVLIIGQSTNKKQSLNTSTKEII